ncbi:DUF6082 family protein [Nonomuraea gerenzanensis]|uniref:DUF6082 family protein n=1 Tax=Nonomuraea gerenzanensis TaxID=93944 RepID=UPI001CD96882|nr:DUF6082 family protein [Nonomuraea gerenzanensis]UBU09983.1 DUF6082 family protein [Nonomuraea gerenzanensis]
MRTRAARLTVTALIVIAGIAIGIALLVSPIALRGIAELAPASQWALLGEVGEAYGPVATLVSAAALLAVAMSVIMQVRTTRISAFHNLRTRQFEVARTYFDHPALIQAEGTAWTGHADDFQVLLSVVLNQWIAHWETMYELGLLNDAEVRHSAGHIFTGTAGRQFWASRRDHLRISATTRRKKAFHRLMNEEFAAASIVKAHPIVVPTPDKSRESLVVAAAGLLGVAALILGLQQLRATNSRTSRG